MNITQLKSCLGLVIGMFASTCFGRAITYERIGSDNSQQNPMIIVAIDQAIAKLYPNSGIKPAIVDDEKSKSDTKKPDEKADKKFEKNEMPKKKEAKKRRPIVGRPKRATTKMISPKCEMA